MSDRNVFKRCELKYLLDPKMSKAVQRAIDENMHLDSYGHSEIYNIYLDTDSYLLARRSIEKPLYKEKLRIRSYGRATEVSKVFVELKKKCESVVYKRRISMPLNGAMEWFTTDTKDFPDTQIGREIDHMRVRYPGIHPAMMVCYEREAYCPNDGSFLRITLDTNITARTYDVDLTSEAGGTSVMPEGYTLMEIKTLYGYPPWLNKVLNENRVYKTSFSKYGTAYKELVLGKTLDQLYNTHDLQKVSSTKAAPMQEKQTVESRHAMVQIAKGAQA